MCNYWTFKKGNFLSNTFNPYKNILHNTFKNNFYIIFQTIPFLQKRKETLLKFESVIKRIQIKIKLIRSGDWR